MLSNLAVVMEKYQYIRQKQLPWRTVLREELDAGANQGLVSRLMEAV